MSLEQMFSELNDAAQEQLEKILLDAEVQTMSIEDMERVFAAEIERIGASAVFAYVADQLRAKIFSFKPELETMRPNYENGTVAPEQQARFDEIEKIVHNLHQWELRFANAAFEAVRFEETQSSDGQTVN